MAIKHKLMFALDVEQPGYDAVVMVKQKNGHKINPPW